jgi:very-long-chain (3R)-3-hydroxyacyl-CoA dehydratase
MDSRDASLRAKPKPGPKPLQSSSPKTQYLILYNFVSAILWLVVLGRVVLLVPLVGFGRVYPAAGQFAKWTQTMALLEVVHAATGKHYLESPMKKMPKLTKPHFRTRTSTNKHNRHASL